MDFPAGWSMNKQILRLADSMSRRSFIGGSDARIIMGSDEAALVRLWREKRGEAVPEDLSGNLVVQLGAATEDLNRSWYERNTSRRVSDVQRHLKHSAIPWMAATLDGIVEGTGAVFEAKFMLPWSFSAEAAAEKYMAQLQHNMWVTHAKSSVLSIITGGGKWVEIAVPVDPLYLAVLMAAEKKFWRCVQSGETPHLVNAEPPRPRLEAIRIVDMSSSNSWAEFAALFRNTRNAHLEHERAKNELKTLMPDDAKEAIGHGVRAKRSKSGAVSFDVLETAAVKRLRLWPRPWPKRRRNSSTPKNRSQPRFGTGGPGRRCKPFAMRRFRAASTSCARRWVSMRLRLSRPRP
jgi:predicted phage-related endonuclease